MKYRRLGNSEIEIYTFLSPGARNIILFRYYKEAAKEMSKAIAEVGQAYRELIGNLRAVDVAYTTGALVMPRWCLAILLISAYIRARLFTLIGFF